MCNEEEDLFETLSNKFKPQYNETLKLLNVNKLVRQHNESEEEWMGRIRVSDTECNYNDIDRHLKVKFIYGLTDNIMMFEIKMLQVIMYLFGQGE